jgi:superfamily II DNA helicase RecQ
MDEKIEEAIVFGLSKLGYQSLRETQRKVIEAYLKGKDVFVCSPTGSGKSLCFEIAPYAIDFMKYDVTAVTMQNITKTVCVVIAPLVSLMKTKYRPCAGKEFLQYALVQKALQST